MHVDTATFNNIKNIHNVCFVQRIKWHKMFYVYGDVKNDMESFSESVTEWLIHLASRKNICVCVSNTSVRTTES